MFIDYLLRLSTDTSIHYIYTCRNRRPNQVYELSVMKLFRLNRGTNGPVWLNGRGSQTSHNRLALFSHLTFRNDFLYKYDYYISEKYRSKLCIRFLIIINQRNALQFLSLISNETEQPV